MNITRFYSLPNALKPVILLLVILAMALAGFARVDKGAHLVGAWFFWLSMLVQLVFMAVIVAMFVLEIEGILTCGREAWPIVEMSYSVGFGAIDIVDMFLVARWNNVGSSAFIVSALLLFACVILYALGAVMMFRIWRGFVQSGGSQNPTDNVLPGSVGAMHPGV